MTALPAIALALAIGLTLAWWSYRARSGEFLARVAAGCRTLGVALLILLLVNPAVVTTLLAPRALVLVDHSVSMYSAGARSDSAWRLAASLGDTTAFGTLTTGEPSGWSLLAEPLATALSAGRAITIVTDGEIADAASISPELLAAATVRVVARRDGDDVAVTDVDGTAQAAVGDSVQLTVDVRRIGVAPDSATVELREGAFVVAKGIVAFGPTGHGRVTLRGVIPGTRAGVRWFQVVRVGPPDAEPGDDERWWPIRVSATPGIVMLAVTPDWDARFLYAALRTVTDAPVRGYAQLLPGQWRRMDDLRPVSAAEVQQAARAADVLAVRGPVEAWRTSGKARLLWPPSSIVGDWYLRPTTASPLANGFGAVDRDSLPPATAIQALDAEATRAWTGATAQLARRGTEVPVIGGREGPSGRTVTLGADGLYRWAFRGGASEQLWRGLIADATAWLLATPDSGAVTIRPVALVTQRGRPVRFRWTGTGAASPTSITLTGVTGVTSDTLRFDGSGEARLALPVGRYEYALAGGGSGTLAVEPYADELVPGAITLTERTADVGPHRTGTGAREWLALFALAVTTFLAEWLLRRHLNMK